MFFDTHCHLDDPKLLPLLPGLLQEAERGGVSRFLVPGVHPDGWQRILSLSKQFPQVLPAFGIHPMHASLATRPILSELRQLCSCAVAVGEIGLDYALAGADRKLQQEAFRAQLRIAVHAGLPVLIHCRKAFADLLGILEEEGVKTIGGVMHAFSGSPETARACLRQGLHISLGGAVTYLNAVRPVAVAASVPLERLLLETDAPDMTPEPQRGSINRPAYLVSTATRVAAIREMTLEELGQATTENARRLFRLDPSAADHQALGQV